MAYISHTIPDTVKDCEGLGPTLNFSWDPSDYHRYWPGILSSRSPRQHPLACTPDPRHGTWPSLQVLAEGTVRVLSPVVCNWGNPCF